MLMSLMMKLLGDGIHAVLVIEKAREIFTWQVCNHGEFWSADRNEQGPSLVVKAVSSIMSEITLWTYFYYDCV